jgi:hypothetical protein
MLNRSDTAPPFRCQCIAPLCGIVVDQAELALTLDAGRDFLNGNSQRP